MKDSNESIKLEDCLDLGPQALFLYNEEQIVDFLALYVKVLEGDDIRGKVRLLTEFDQKLDAGKIDIDAYRKRRISSKEVVATDEFIWVMRTAYKNAREVGELFGTDITGKSGKRKSKGQKKIGVLEEVAYVARKYSCLDRKSQLILLAFLNVLS